jgi:hypothetical protein
MRLGRHMPRDPKETGKMGENAFGGKERSLNERRLHARTPPSD